MLVRRGSWAVGRMGDWQPSPWHAEVRWVWMAGVESE